MESSTLAEAARRFGVTSSSNAMQRDNAAEAFEFWVIEGDPVRRG